MIFENNTVTELKIAYIGGGSRGWAWSFMMDLATDAELHGTVRLYDIDREAAEQNAVIGGKISAHPDALGRWEYVVADSLESTLVGADVVVMSILPGTFEEMRSDVHSPEKYGVLQSVGDTTGPGGFLRAMRAVPMFTEIGRAIRDFSPGAWVINYTNPMAVCLRELYDVFPEIRAFGCCHEVFGTQTLLASMLRETLGIGGIPREEIRVNVLGLNHFTWFDSASYGHLDLFPLYEKFIGEHYDNGFEERDGNWMNSSFSCAHRVKFDLFRRYGLIAAAGDRHLAEFIPTYLHDRETIARWKFSLTTVDWRVNDLAERRARSAALRSGEEPIVLKPSGEEGHLLMKALLGLGDMVSNVNLPNVGQLEGIPRGTVVETNALFRRGGILPVHAGKLPGDLHALVLRHAEQQTNTLTAAQNCDFRFALNVFRHDPMTERLSDSDAESLLREMLANTARYLPKAWAL
jgi:alpha-galactosidase